MKKASQEIKDHLPAMMKIVHDDLKANLSMWLTEELDQRIKAAVKLEVSRVLREMGRLL